MKKGYNETKHLENRQSKIATGFQLKEYQQDIEKTIYFVYELGYELKEIDNFLDEVKGLVKLSLKSEEKKNETIIP